MVNRINKGRSYGERGIRGLVIMRGRGKEG